MNKSRRLQFAASPIETALSIVLFLIILFAAFAVRAENTSFNITNQIYTATDLRSLPGLGSLGGAINVMQYRQVSITVSGQMSTTNTGTLTLALIRSDVNNPPGTNDWDWSVGTSTVGVQASAGGNGALVFTVPNGVITNAAGTLTNSFINWHTNLDETLTGPANWYAVYNFTNNAAAGIFTNVANLGGTNLGASGMIRLNKKIIPIRYPN